MSSTRETSTTETSNEDIDGSTETSTDGSTGKSTDHGSTENEEIRSLFEPGARFVPLQAFKRKYGEKLSKGHKRARLGVDGVIIPK